MSKHVDMQPLDIKTEYSAEWSFPRQKKYTRKMMHVATHRGEAASLVRNR